MWQIHKNRKTFLKTLFIYTREEVGFQKIKLLKILPRTTTSFYLYHYTIFNLKNPNKSFFSCQTHSFTTKSHTVTLIKQAYLMLQSPSWNPLASDIYIILNVWFA